MSFSANGAYYLRAWNPTTDEYSSPPSVTGGDPVSNVALTQVPSSADLEEIHGQPGFALTFAAPVPDPFNADSYTTVVHFQIGSLRTAGDATSTKLVAANSDYFKSVWSYMLLDDDGTKGVHNPRFTITAIIDTAEKVEGVIATLPAP